MTKDEILQNIIEAIEPLGEINADTVIADCDDIDSLALFSIVVFLKQKLKKKCKSGGSFQVYHGGEYYRTCYEAYLNKKNTSFAMHNRQYQSPRY